MPSLTPTVIPTFTPTYTPALIPAMIPKLLPPRNPSVRPTIISKSKTNDGILSTYLPWFITGMTVILCLILFCVFICFVVYVKQKHKSQENINDTITVNTYSDTSNMQKSNKRNNNDSKSIESMYDKNLKISPNTKGKTNYNGKIQDIIQQNLKKKKRKDKPGEDSPAIISPSKNIKNEGIISNRDRNCTIDNNGILLEYNEYDDDIEIITDDNKTTITPGNV